MQTIQRILNSRWLLWGILALPWLLIGGGYLTGHLFYGEAVHQSGVYAARLLLLTLAVTPLRLMFPGRRWTAWLLARRRYFGVASFGYALLHTAIYLQRIANLPRIAAEAADPGMLAGWLGLAILLPLAATSNDWATRRLRRAWKALHRAAYAAAVLGFAHWVLVAFDPVPALLHVGLLGALEGYRLWRSAAGRVA